MHIFITQALSRIDYDYFQKGHEKRFKHEKNF